MADQLYIEDGYVETSYFERLVDVQVGTLNAGGEGDIVSSSFSLVATVEIADTTGYYIPDYIEEGYIGILATEFDATIQCQISVVAQGEIADDTGYYIPDYIEEGYISAIIEGSASATSNFTVAADVGVVKQAIGGNNGGDEEPEVYTVIASINADAGIIKDASSDFGALFTPSIVVVATKSGEILLQPALDLLATVSKFAGNEATLDNLVNLSLQGDRTRSTQSQISTDSQLAVDVEKITGFSSNITSAFNTSLLLTTNVITQLSVNSTLTANAISYQTKTLGFGRPNNFVGYTYDGIQNTWSQDSRGIQYQPITSQLYGNYFLRLDNDYGLADDNPAAASLFNTVSIGANDDFYFSVYIDRNAAGTIFGDGTYTNSRNVFASLSNGFNNVQEINNETYSISTGNYIDIGLYRTGNDANGNDIMVPYAKVGTLELYDTSRPNFQQGQLTVRRSNGVVYFENARNDLVDSGNNSTAFNVNQITLYAPETYRNYEPGFDKVLFKVGTAGSGDNYYDVTSDEYTVVYATFEQTLDDITAFNLSGDALITSTSNVVANTVIKANASVDLNNNFTLSVDTAITKPTNATLDTQTIVDANIIRQKNADAQFASQITSNVNANVIREAQTDLNVEIDTSTTVTKILQFNVLTDSLATQLSAINKIGNTLVAMDSRFESAITASSNKEFDSDIVCAITTTATPTITRDNSSAIQVATTQDVTADRFAQFDADLNTVFAQQTTARKTASFDADIDSVLDTQLTVRAIRNNEIDLFTQSSVIANNQIFRNVVVGINVDTSQTVITNRTARAESTINAQLTVSADGKLLVLPDELIYVIPRETREFAINRENREYTILEEDREYIVGG